MQRPPKTSLIIVLQIIQFFYSLNDQFYRIITDYELQEKIQAEDPNYSREVI